MSSFLSFIFLHQGLSMRVNQPTGYHMGMGNNQGGYFPFNVAALATMSNRELEVGIEEKRTRT